MRFRLLLLPLVVTLLAACNDAATAPQPAASTTLRASYGDEIPEEKVNLRVPIYITDYAPCWGDDGELVTFEGTMHVMYTAERDPMGRLRIRMHYNPQALMGTGWQSGIMYVANGTMQSHETWLPAGELPTGYVFHDRWQYVAQGDAPDFVHDIAVRLVLNDAGELVPVFESERIECR